MTPTDLREVVSDIRTQVVREESVRHPPSTWDNLLPCLQTARNLRMAYEHMYAVRNGIGRLPPRPNTRRARIGAVLVAVVQSMLFWYTPQILRFNNAGTAAMEAACLSSEKQLEAMQHLVREIDELRLELRVRAPGMGAVPSLPSMNGQPIRSAALDAFEFDLRNEMRGPAERVQARLKSHLETILSIAPGPPDGPWVELGCGDGAWCALLKKAGRNALGIEPNARAAAHCSGAGLAVEHMDCLEFLRDAADHSFAVIASFHEMERHPFPYVFESIRQAARVLKPGGFLVIEAASPGNILESTHRFWQDPANTRLLPEATVESLFHYCGFRAVSRRYLNAGAAADRFPWTELDLVKRLDDHFHGPGDYALIARSRLRSAAVGQ